jgi:single-strand DNA-binding protein
MFNKVILVGNLTRDVELRYLPNGSSVAKFGLATNRRWKDNHTGDQREEVMFIDISVFGRSAEIANQYLRKGSKVLVEGRLSLNQWTDQSGQKRSKHEIVADSVQFMESKAESAQNAGQYGGGYSNQHQSGGYGQQQAPQQNNYNNQSQQSYNNNNMGNNDYGSQNSNQNNQYDNQGYSEPQKQSIPEIDIDDEDIPF